MSKNVPLCALVLVTLAAPCARAGGWSVGANLSAGLIKSGTTGGSTGFWALPTNVLVYQPAIRLAYGDARHMDELQADGGALVLDQAGPTLTLIAGSLGYQHVFTADWPLAPFANAGIGFLREGGADRTTVETSYGAGLGVRHLVRESHGSLRAEVRWDQLAPDESLGRPRLNAIGLRLGFDLWL